jgi:hypothetical protein
LKGTGRADVRVAQIIGEDDDHVRSALGGVLRDRNLRDGQDDQHEQAMRHSSLRFPQ